MSETAKTPGGPVDTEQIVERLGPVIAEVMAEVVPSDISEEQATSLRRAVGDALVRETRESARRAARRFTDELRRREKSRKREIEKEKAREEIEWVERLSLHLRVQHMILFSSTILLIGTGLPIKFHESAVSGAIIQLLGGPGVTAILHRIGAVGLTGIGLYHLFYCLLFETGRRDFGLLLPKPQDVKDFFSQMGYYLGLKKDKPMFGRFSYIEKFDYWAVYWGMVVMITSGFVLWFKDVAINQFGKVAYDIAREGHSDEALLATLAIIIWHFYNVHFNPAKFPGSLTWLNGKITIEEFREEHALQYEEMVSGGGMEKKP